MTLPRQFLPQTTYFITRRCTQRLFLLKPTPLTTQIFLYCLAVAAQKTGVVIHAICVISNHYHVVASDPETSIAEFYGWLHKYVSKAVNCSLGRSENMWSSEKANVIALNGRDTVLDKVLYTLCNPVKARLVAHGEQWPGVWLYKRSHSRTVERPNVYFSEEGEMPEKVSLNIEPPPQFNDLSENDYHQLVADNLELRELEIHNQMAAKLKFPCPKDTFLQYNSSDG